MTTIDLNGSWEFKAASIRDTLPASATRAKEWLHAVVPGTVHTDLMTNGVIPDPFFGMNENDVQWVDGQQWTYRRSFDVPGSILKEKIVRLRAEGLDTYATITINGTRVGSTENMFIEHRVDVKRQLRPGTNSISITFDSPVARSKFLEQKSGSLAVAHEAHRVYVRKAQYSFGWDWGPRLTTSGIWRAISIEAFSDCIFRDPYVKVLSIEAHHAVVRITSDFEGNDVGKERMTVTLQGRHSTVSGSGIVKKGKASLTLRIPKPELWWPNGQGGQPLYTARLVLRQGDKVLDEKEVSFAIRTVALLQEKDAEGRSFVLVVNGRKIFCKGADWIPADTFLPRIDDARYEKLLLLARDSHMNMIRVWGGGIYEDDRFYDLCDRLGLLVWQDFMFACGEYPDDRWFQESVQVEAECVVKRLRNHPSIALWCGNNECEWLFCTQNPGKHPDKMRGATIFRDILASACKRFDGTRQYWRSSPFGAGFPNDESNGNHHQWQVWSLWKDFASYENDHARFVTEFGFQGPANVKTMESCTQPADRHPQSIVMEHHNKQVEGPERVLRFLGGHYRVDTEFARFTYLGQLVQAEALKRAVEHWRRRKFKTAGALFWQLNDCWPVTSWAVIDSALRPKAAYFYAKRFFAPLLLSFRKREQSIDIWLTSDLPTSVEGTLIVSRRSFDGIVQWTEELHHRMPANVSRKILSISAAKLDGLTPASEYLLAEWKDINGGTAENRLFFAEPKHLSLPDPGLMTEIQHRGDDGHTVRVTATTFAKNIRLELLGEDAIFEDNYFDADAGIVRSIAFRSSSSPLTMPQRLILEYER